MYQKYNNLVLEQKFISPLKRVKLLFYVTFSKGNKKDLIQQEAWNCIIAVIVNLFLTLCHVQRMRQNTAVYLSHVGSRWCDPSPCTFTWGMLPGTPSRQGTVSSCCGSKLFPTMPATWWTKTYFQGNFKVILKKYVAPPLDWKHLHYTNRYGVDQMTLWKGKMLRRWLLRCSVFFYWYTIALCKLI